MFSHSILKKIVAWLAIFTMLIGVMPSSAIAETAKGYQNSTANYGGSPYYNLPLWAMAVTQLLGGGGSGDSFDGEDGGDGGLPQQGLFGAPGDSGPTIDDGDSGLTTDEGELIVPMGGLSMPVDGLLIPMGGGTYTHTWDGSDNLTLYNGESVDLDFSETGFPEWEKALTIEEGATVTINGIEGRAPFFIGSDYIDVGNNATLIFTGTADTSFGIDVEEKNLTLISNDRKRVLTLEGTAESITLVGFDTNGFSIKNAGSYGVKTKALSVDGGVHGFILPVAFTGYGADALVLVNGGSLNINDGKLTLKGETCTVDGPGSPFVAGSGLVAEGNANVNLKAGSHLEILGGDEYDLNYLQDQIHGGSAISGHIHIYFEPVTGTQESTLIMGNGADFTGDVEKADGEIAENGSVTVHKPANMYLKGAGWVYEDENAYNYACAGSGEAKVNVSPPLNPPADVPGTGAGHSQFTISASVTGVPDLVWFEAQQYGGASGIGDSQGIELTYNKDVSGLTLDNITLEGADAAKPEQDLDNLKIWRIPISDFDQGMASLTIKNWGAYDGSTGSSKVDLYKDARVSLTYEGEEYGGSPGTVDSEGIIITFDQGVSDLTSENIELQGATAEAPSKDSLDGTVWRIPISYIESTAVALVRVKGLEGYIITTPQPYTVNLHMDQRTHVSFAASQVDGQDGRADSQGILLAFDKDVSGLTKDEITLTVASASPTAISGVTNKGDNDAKNWMVTVSDFENNQEVEVAVDDWSYDGNNYHVTTSPQSVTLYKDVREDITFSGVQIGGAENTTDTTGIKLTFSKAISSLDASQIIIDGANVADVTCDLETGVCDKWIVAFSSITPGINSIKVNVKDLDDYQVSTKDLLVPVYAMTTDISYIPIQIGGDDGVSTTEGILLTFNRPVPKPTANLTGATGRDITDNSDTDGSTWYIPLANIGVENQENVIIEVEIFQGLVLNEPEKSVQIFKDTRIHVSYTASQVGGESGKKDSEGILLTFNKDVSGLTVNEITLAKLDESRVRIKGLSKSDDKNWLIEIEAEDFEDNQSVEVSLRDWSDGDIRYHMPTPAQTITLYKNLETITLEAMQIEGVNGISNTRGILLKFSTPVSKPTVSVYGATALGVTDYEDEDESTWYFPIIGIGAGNSETVRVTISGITGLNPACSQQDVTIYKDLRTPISFTATEEGGQDGETDSRGILLWFTLDVDGLTQDKISVATAEGVPLLISQLSDYDDDNPRSWFITLESFENNQAVEVTVAEWEGESKSYHLSQPSKTVTLYKNIHTYISFTSRQTGGVETHEGHVDIQLEFDQSVEGLTLEEIRLETTTGASISPLESLVKIDDSGKVWQFSVGVDKFADGFVYSQIAKISVSNWVSGGFSYRVESDPQTIILDKDLRDEILFNTKQVGGESGIARTTAIEITFDKGVSGLTLDKISLTGAKADSLTQVGGEDGKAWRLDISNITVSNGQKVKVEISEWSGYRLLYNYTDVQVFKVVPIGFHAIQMEGSYGNATSAGILLKFDSALTRPLEKADFQLFLRSGKAVNVADPVPYLGEGNYTSWYLKFTGEKLWANQEEITVRLNSSESGETPGNIMVAGREVAESSIEKTTILYKDDRTHLTCQAEQVGGSPDHLGAYGLNNTKYINISYRTKDGQSYKDYTFRQYDISVEGAIVTKTQWVTDKANDAENGLRVYLNSLSYENGDRVKITTKVPYGTAIADTIMEVFVYKDPRTPINYKVATNGSTDTADSTRMMLTFSEPYTITLEDIKIYEKGTENLAPITIDGPLTPSEDKKVYTLPIKLNENVTDNTGIDLVLDVSKFPEYCFESATVAGLLKKDTRHHIQVIVEQLGGKYEEKDSTGIKLTFINRYEYQSGLSLYYKSTNKKFERPPYIDRYLETKGGNPTGNTIFEIKFPTGFQGNFANGEAIGIQIETHFPRTRAYELEVREGSTSEGFTPTEGDGFTYVELYRNLSLDDKGKSLVNISPGIMYKDDENKMLTLVGNFDAAAVRDILFRTPGQTNEESLAYKNKGEAVRTPDNMTAITVDVSYVELIKNEGVYEVAVRTNKTITEYLTFVVSSSSAFSSENYGVLTVTQMDNKQFAVEVYKSENDSKNYKAQGKTLLTFRGRMQTDAAGGVFKVFSDSTMNKALEYRAGTDDYITISREGGGKVKVSASEGTLRWNGIPMATKFSISLDPANTYINKRLEAGNPVQLTSDYHGSFDIFLMEAGIDDYNIYEDEFSLAGRLILGNSIPFLAENLQAGAVLHEMILREGLRELPPTHAQAWVDFSPEDWLGDIVGANGKFNFEINSLPETNPKYVSLDGELSINDLLYIDGEFVFTWGVTRDGRTLFIPDKVKFFVRSDAEGAGIPLVPPVIVAYITGVGGGFEGLAGSVYEDFHYIPPFKLSLSGAIKDATGMFIDVEKATITLGPSEISAYVDSMKILKLIELKKVGMATGLRPSAESGIPPDFYFRYGGSFEFTKGPIEIEADIDLGIELLGPEMEGAVLTYINQAKNEKNNFVVPNKATLDALYSAFNFWGNAHADAKFEWGPFEVSGSGGLEVNKSKISGYVEGKIGLWTPGASFVWYYGDKFKYSISPFSMPRTESGIVLGYDENGGKLVVTNIINKGSFGPSAPTGRMMLMEGGTGTQEGTLVPDIEAGYLMGITSDVKHSVIEVYRLVGEGEESNEELVDIIALSEDDWMNTSTSYKNDGYGEFTAAYEIPEGGDYRFVADGPIYCHVLQFLPVSGFESVSVAVDGADTTKGNVTWILNDAAMARDDLSVRLTLHDGETGKFVSTLTVTGETEDEWLPDPEDPESDWKIYQVPKTKVAAKPMSFNYDLGESLSTGSYFVKASLLAPDPDPEELGDINVGFMDTETFEYTNPGAPGQVGNIQAQELGKGAVKLTWDEVAGADGYLVTILEESGVEVESLTPIDVTKNSNGEIVREAIIQAGTAILKDGGGIFEAGLKFGQDYTVSIRAYKNKSGSFGCLSGGEEEMSYNVPIYGLAGTKALNVSEPQIPDFTILVGRVEGSEDDATLVYEEARQDGLTPTYIINTVKPTIKVTVDEAVSGIKVYELIQVYEVNDGIERIRTVEKEIQTISGSSGSFDYDFEEDGIYYLRFDTSLGIEESSKLIRIEVDTKPPYLSVDGDSRTAPGGKIQIFGMVEQGATVTDNGEPVAVENGTFTIEGTTENTVTSKLLLAVDEARNVTELYLDILYLSEDGGEGDNGGTSSSGSSGGNSPDQQGESSLGIDGLSIKSNDGKGLAPNADGSVTLSEGGRVGFKSGASINVPGGTTIGADGSIHLPEGQGAAIKLPSGIELDIKGGRVIVLDSDSPLGYRIEYDGEFGDVQESDWFADDVAFAYTHNLFAGTGADSFSPNSPMTRGMLVTVLGRLSGIDISEIEGSAFNDVDADKYYAPYIEWARQAGVVSGVGQGLFAPDSNITRQDLAVILYNYLKFINLDMERSRTYEGFNDGDAISDYALEAVKAYFEGEVISGKPGNMFDPKGSATRAELASMLYRFICQAK